jgi:hypothetical protein
MLHTVISFVVYILMYFLIIVEQSKSHSAVQYLSLRKLFYSFVKLFLLFIQYFQSWIRILRS